MAKHTHRLRQRLPLLELVLAWLWEERDEKQEVQGEHGMGRQ